MISAGGAVIGGAVLTIVACGGGRTMTTDGAAGAPGGNGGDRADAAGLGGAGGIAGGAGAGGIAGGAGAGGGGGRGGAGGNPACASALIGETCDVPGVGCGAEACTNVCQFCNIAVCMNGRWQRVEVFPVPCFACGPELTCQSYTEYCRTILGGAVGSPSFYSCIATPAACRQTPTCACLQSQTIPGSCTQAGAGELTVTLAAP